jgi:hypothetical protein
MKFIIRQTELIECFRPKARRWLKFSLIALSLAGVAWLLGLRLAVTEAGAMADCAGVTQVPATECEALVTLYHSTNGPGWIRKASWLVFGPNAPCNWYGVTCSQGPR